MTETYFSARFLKQICRKAKGLGSLVSQTTDWGKGGLDCGPGRVDTSSLSETRQDEEREDPCVRAELARDLTQKQSAKCDCVCYILPKKKKHGTV